MKPRRARKIFDDLHKNTNIRRSQRKEENDFLLTNNMSADCDIALPIFRDFL